MWTGETTDETCLDCHLPFSFYFDLIEGAWKSPRSGTSNNLSLHRICTLARKQGASFVVRECALGQAPIAQEIDNLDRHYGGGGRASAIQLSFFRGEKSAENIDDVDADALIAAATIINYAPPNADFLHSYIYEAIVAAPHQRSEDGTTKRLLNNYICRDTTFTRAVRGRDFSVSGFYYCQQNNVIHVCAHACLRMALNSIDGSQALLSSADINSQLGLAPPISGLSVGNVEDVIAMRTGTKPVVVNCATLSAPEYLSLLTAYVESGFIVLFVFTTGQTNIEHVVTAFGYTRNSDEWHPQAIPGYSGPSTAPFYRSSAWVDHFVIHDDNLGTYYTLSSRAFEVDPLIKASFIIGVHPHQPDILPHWAEGLASVVIKRFLYGNPSFDNGRWYQYLVQQTNPFVMRPILMDKKGYQEHLRSSEGHDRSRLSDAEVKLTDALPDWFWMVEFSLPALFTGNRSKLGEVLIITQVGSATTGVQCVAGLRAPGVIAITTSPGSFVSHKVGLRAHSPIYVSRMHDNEW
ncbi:hypothetical protein [Bradyrhizobium guangdongense]|uniref:Uncharacterized protein n=1 Tax=Bradyrhizobium guangdongense TaxID=1325090 RepID=A0ABX6UR86_9BRAD|nr:hypothetical protein [Bradyrhizobium guangdongense]QAU42200.1 hypothetical protein X265_34370 [Bradyrhizobium guangdongense]QOZ63259.1 hypothetical protein XH86_34410 [Bradyrhizobium guangdongense]